MNRMEKTQEVEDLKVLFGDAQLTVLTEYSGLDVASMTALRRTLRQVETGYRVVKNTLARLATADTDNEVLHPHFTGPLGVAFANEDPAAAAKALQLGADAVVVGTAITGVDLQVQRYSRELQKPVTN